VIINNDNIQALRELEDNSIDSVVTDPPYGLSFMGKKWDYDVPSKELWLEVFRVLKPGGHLLSFGGSRTYHRLAVGIEDAGFEIRDQIMWVYGSGFPKSLNIGKAVDKLQGNERVVVGNRKAHDIRGNALMEATVPEYKKEISQIEINITKGNSPYEGWGTALKPAHEPIVLARKPLAEKTIASNVLKWSTGGINIDECRVEVSDTEKEHFEKEWDREQSVSAELGGVAMNSGLKAISLRDRVPTGRFPANFIHDGSDEVVSMFPQTKSQGHWSKTKTTGFGKFGNGKSEYQGVGEKDKEQGSASRFFYCAKASKKERNAGLDGFEEKQIVTFATANGTSGKPSSISEGRDTRYKNHHPTVKPIALMRYLSRLITPKNGIVLDPFMGSGTTGIACKLEGFEFVGIEIDKEYFKIAEARIENYKE